MRSPGAGGASRCVRGGCVGCGRAVLPAEGRRSGRAARARGRARPPGEHPPRPRRGQRPASSGAPRKPARASSAARSRRSARPAGRAARPCSATGCLPRPGELARLACAPAEEFWLPPVVGGSAGSPPPLTPSRAGGKSRRFSRQSRTRASSPRSPLHPPASPERRAAASPLRPRPQAWGFAPAFPPQRASARHRHPNLPRPPRARSERNLNRRAPGGCPPAPCPRPPGRSPLWNTRRLPRNPHLLPLRALRPVRYSSDVILPVSKATLPTFDPLRLI